MQPPGWVDSAQSQLLEQQVRWSFLNLLAQINPHSAIGLALSLAQAAPQQVGMRALSLLWRASVDAQKINWDTIGAKEQIWLKAALLQSKEDKQKLKQMWPEETAQWKGLILDAFYQCADANDLDFLLGALGQGGELSIKSCCAILVGIRQGKPVV